MVLRLGTRRRLGLGGFKLRKRAAKLCRWIFRRRPGYLRLESPVRTTSGCSRSATSRLRLWAHRLKQLQSKAAAAALRFSRRPGRRYAALDGGDTEAAVVPKGHLAVYVGRMKDDGDWQRVRVLVPVVYFNHPLFGELLREAEEEYGFDPPGGITIPCQISEFERVRTRIAAVHGGCRRLLSRRHTLF